MTDTVKFSAQEKAVRLDDYVQANRDKLNSSDRGTLKQCAEKATNELGYAVAPSRMRDAMQVRGIETKRIGQRQSEKMAMLSEIEKLTAENMQLRRTLAAVAASEYVPEDIKNMVFGGLSQEIREAITAVAD